jgi:hypothetical protein
MHRVHRLFQLMEIAGPTGGDLPGPRLVAPGQRLQRRFYATGQLGQRPVSRLIPRLARGRPE